jgi:hypothetical protein
MIWNYFGDALARLRAWPRLGLAPGAADPESWRRRFPGALCLAPARRQATAGDLLGRAGASGQYALADGEQPAPPPPFDRDAIGRLVRFAGQCEDGWRGWFAAHSIVPFEIVHEDMAAGLTEVVHELAAFLGVALPPGLGPIRPRLRRQADHCTDRLIERFNSPARCSAAGLAADATRAAAAEDAEELSFHRDAGRRPSPAGW